MTNEVLESTRFLIESPSYVFIDKDKLDETAKRFAGEQLIIPDWNMPVYPEGKSKGVIDFFMLGDTINFAYTDFETKEKFEASYQGKPWRGAMGMRACLKRALEGDFPELLEGEFLADISKFEMERIFKGNIRIPMFDERLAIFREVGEVLCDNYGGHFYNLVDASNHRLFNDGEGLVEKLTTEFPLFDDSVMYGKKLVIFDKRAQLAAGTLYGRFRNEGEFVVEDIDDLTVFADYVLPKGLRDLGILSYEKSLAERVDKQELIPRHSREELEVRASTVHAAKMLVDRINDLRARNKSDNAKLAERVNALHIDYKLWSESRKQSSPHHLTITTDY